MSARLRSLPLLRALRTACALVLLALVQQSVADEDREFLREAVRRGEIISLAALLDSVERRYPGEVVEVELERDSGRWLYEVDLLRPDGIKSEFLIDAHTAEILSIDGAAPPKSPAP
jgi:uncharacterized membrane protein YkoI